MIPCLNYCHILRHFKAELIEFPFKAAEHSDEALPAHLQPIRCCQLCLQTNKVKMKCLQMYLRTTEGRRQLGGVLDLVIGKDFSVVPSSSSSEAGCRTVIHGWWRAKWVYNSFSQPAKAQQRRIQFPLWWMGKSPFLCEWEGKGGFQSSRPAESLDIDFVAAGEALFTGLPSDTHIQSACNAGEGWDS